LFSFHEGNGWKKTFEQLLQAKFLKEETDFSRGAGKMVTPTMFPL
jgi:hypothetical protein